MIQVQWEITKTEKLLYFDLWFFQPKWTQLAYKCFERFRSQMGVAQPDFRANSAKKLTTKHKRVISEVEIWKKKWKRKMQNKEKKSQKNSKKMEKKYSVDTNL